MKILRENDKSVTFECGVCGCKFIAEQGEYKYAYIPWEWQIYECECPYCKNLVQKELRLS